MGLVYLICLFSGVCVWEVELQPNPKALNLQSAKPMDLHDDCRIFGDFRKPPSLDLWV